MMVLTKSFAESLLRKLTIGNSRSILLNAIPGRLLTRLALTDLDIIGKGLSKQFITALTSQKKFSFKFSIDLNEKSDNELKQIARIGKRLAAIKYDHDDYQKEHGVETFGFGFPIWVRKNPRDSAKFIASPVFIFPLDIKQTFDKEREWIINRYDESEIKLNEVLVSYLENEEHIKIPAITEEMLEDGLLDKDEINAFCQNLISIFEKNANLTNTWESYDILPEKLSTTDADFKNNSIIWNGVFGLYKSQKQSQIKEMEALLDDFENITENNETKFEWEHVHSPKETDPSQNGVLRSLDSNKNIVIEGPPGTGKSQTLTAVIASALANNKKILIVCEKRTALEVLKENLIKLIPELTKCIALIEDTSRDRGNIVETVRNRTATYLAGRHHLSLLHEDIKRFESKASLIEKQYEALRTPKKKWWSNLVYKWIATNKTDEDISVYFSLQKVFAEQGLDEVGYKALIGKIEDCAILYARSENTLEQLELKFKPIIFEENINDRTIIFTLKETIAKLKNIQVELKAEASQFLETVNTESQNNLRNNRTLLVELSEIVNKHQPKKIDIFNPSFSTKILSTIFAKQKQIITESAKAKQLLRSIQSFWKEYFQKNISANQLMECTQYIDTNCDNIVKLRQAKLINEPINKIGSYGFNMDALSKILEILQKADKEVDKYINKNNYSVPQAYIHEYEKIIADFIFDLQTVIENDSNIRHYFSWKLLEKTLLPIERQWITLLKAYNSKQWKNIVENTWLFHNLFHQDQNDKFPTDDQSLQVLRELGLKIQKQQKEVIAHNLNNWCVSGQNKIKATGIQINQLYNLRGPKGGTRNSLRKIIQINPDAFTDFFPVLMLNPSTCSSLLPLKKDSFDIVIFDEASQLRIEDTYPALIRGKQVIVSGDSQQMPPSSYFESSKQIIDDNNDDDDIEELSSEELSVQLLNSSSKESALTESLLQFAIDIGFTKTYLDMHYRSRHPNLIAFSNVCFYGSRLVPMPETITSPPISYFHVNGLYENRKNLAEAKEIVRLIKDEIACNLSVGVATFNLEQRNLILELIGDERSANPEFQNKMNEFDKNGFFVKNLENVQGDERDIILISTTFGSKSDGSFRLSFGPIGNKNNGHRLLNVIITRAKHKLYILTSIPEIKISSYRERLTVNETVDGTTGLLAYLAFAKAVSENNVEETQAILSYISSKIARGQSEIQGDYLGLSESPFEEEVYCWLAEVIGTDRIQQQYPCGGFRIDMVVLPKNANGALKLAIECDGAAYHSDQLSWHYDMYRQEQLEKNGFKFHRIWSTNWWRNPKDELQKLLRTIEELN